MNPLSISKLIFDTIPQLYEAGNGRYPVDLKIAGENFRVFSLVPLSPALKKYLTQAEATWEELRPFTEGEISQIIEREWVQQKFVVSWLEERTSLKTWGGILDYVRRLSRRLTENQLMTKTLVIEPGIKSGGVRLSDPTYFKVLDWLGNSTYTYFRVTEDLEVTSFEGIAPDSPKFRAVSEGGDFRFYPDVLHPVITHLEVPGAVIVHVAQNGSILIADRNGLIASKRALESWTIYDIDHVIESVADLLNAKFQGGGCDAKPTHAACSLFQILFDISMKRHGGLLVMDHPKNFSRYLITGIEQGLDSPLHSLFTRKAFDGLTYSTSEVRKLVELSSIDGALVMDLSGNLLQFGSMVVSHPSTPNRFGMREAAGYSAAKHGATAFKVSADGHMTLFFTTPELTGEEVHWFHFY